MRPGFSFPSGAPCLPRWYVGSASARLRGEARRGGLWCSGVPRLLVTHLPGPRQGPAPGRAAVHSIPESVARRDQWQGPRCAARAWQGARRRVSARRAQQRGGKREGDRQRPPCFARTCMSTFPPQLPAQALGRGRACPQLLDSADGGGGGCCASAQGSDASGTRRPDVVGRSPRKPRLRARQRKCSRWLPCGDLRVAQACSALSASADGRALNAQMVTECPGSDSMRGSGGWEDPDLWPPTPQGRSGEHAGIPTCRGGGRAVPRGACPFQHSHPA